MRVHFYFDVVCPYAWMASLQLPELCHSLGAELIWEPVLLGGLFQAHDAPQRPGSEGSPQRQQHQAAELLRQGERLGLQLKRPEGHPVSSLRAMRLLLTTPPGAWPQLSEALFRGYWQESRSLIDESWLRSLARAWGGDWEQSSHPSIKQALRARSEEAASLGVFGVPSCRVGDQLWWGQDRLHLLALSLGASREEAERWRRPPSQSTRPASLRPWTFFHDFSSPFSYLASTQVERLAKESGRPLERAPVLLGALFRELGTPNVPLLAMSEAKRQHMLRDLQRWARFWQVDFRFPERFPLRTVTALRVAIQEPAATACLYHAAWGEGADIGDPEQLHRVLEAAGFPARALIEGSQRPEIKRALRENTQRALDAGVFGVPSFEVDGILRWGQDRVGDLEAALGLPVAPAQSQAPSR